MPMTAQSTPKYEREPDGPAQIRISLIAGVVWSAVALALALAGLGLRAFVVIIALGGIVDTIILDRWGRRRARPTPHSSVSSAPFATRTIDQSDSSLRVGIDRLQRRLKALHLPRDNIFAPTRRWWALSAACSMACLVSINAASFFFLALPAVGQHFHASFAELQWIVSAYLLAFGVAQIPAVPITNTFGGRRVLRIGAWSLVLGSLLSGHADSLTSVTCGRVLQGIGAALATQGGNAIIEHAFPPEQRRPALGGVYLTAFLSRLFGPLLGGLLIVTIGWQAVLYVGVPFGIFAIIVVQFAAPRPHSTVNRRVVDHVVPGCAFLAVVGSSVLACLLVTSGWSTDVLHLACVAMIVLASGGAWGLFVIWKWRLPPEYRFFSSRAFVGASLAEFTASFLSVPTLLYVTIFLVATRDKSILVVGLYLMAASAAFAFGYASIARMSLRVKPRFQLTISLAMLTLGLAVFQATIASSATDVVLLIPLLLVGYGSGLMVMPAYFAVRVAAPHAKEKIASTMIAMSGMLGGAWGIAMFTFHFVDVFGHRAAIKSAHQTGDIFAIALRDNFQIWTPVGIVVALVAYILIRDYDKRDLGRQNRAKEELGSALIESVST